MKNHKLPEKEKQYTKEVMKDKSDLKSLLHRIDGREYKAYKEIKAQYQLDDYVLIIDHVQGDPFAVPSRMRLQIPMKIAGFPDEAFLNQSRANSRHGDSMWNNTYCRRRLSWQIDTSFGLGGGNL